MGLTPDRYALVGTVLDRRFRMEAAVAEGGFGLVYRAQHLRLQQPVAVKVLKTPAEYNDEARAEFVARFEAEARTIARLRHPAIVNVLDFGHAEAPSGETVAYMALEWVDGATLEDQLAPRKGRNGRSPDEVLRLLDGIADALAHAHAEGIVHRDLKPANLMEDRVAGAPILRLVDFGIAKVMEPDEALGSGATRTSSSHVRFSPRYAAPEQFSAVRTGPWTDEHALALLVVELLTDRDPYRADDFATVFRSALNVDRPTPRSFGLDVGAWEPVLARALALNPGDRYPDVAAFWAALRATLPNAAHVWIANEEVTAAVPPWRPSAEPAPAVTPPRPVGGDTLAPLHDENPALSSPSPTLARATAPAALSRRWSVFAVLVAVVASGALLLRLKLAPPAAPVAVPVPAPTPTAVTLPPARVEAPEHPAAPTPSTASAPPSLSSAPPLPARPSPTRAPRRPQRPNGTPGPLRPSQVHID